MKRNHLVALFLLLIACPVGAQMHNHGAMSDGDGQFNPFVASDPRGGFYLVYVERKEGKSNVWLRRSSDGKNFSTPVRVNDRDGDATVRNENPPKVIADAQGQVYVCWANERGRWKGNIRFARSTDGGMTFAPAITLNSDGDGAPVGHAFQSLALDQRGRVYAAWIDERNKQQSDRGAEIWMAVSGDHGQSFSRDRRVLGDVCECCRTGLQIDAAGNLYLAYRMVPSSGPMCRDIVLARSQDGGKNFAQTVVSHDQWEINGCPVAGPTFSVDRAGKLTVIWFMGGGEQPGLYYATSTDRGKSFSPRHALDPQQPLSKHAQTVWLADGRLLVAWDYGTDKAATAWGILDPQKGMLERSSGHDEVTYPIVAANGRVAVVTGMRAAAHTIVTYVEDVKGMQVSASSASRAGN